MAALIDTDGIAALVNTAINRIWPDKSEQEKQALAAQVMAVQGQIDINKTEAANPSVFVSGWRPFVGWVCGMACAWNWVGLPVARFVCAVLNHPLSIAPVDLSELMPMLVALLGLGGYRTIERLNDKARQ